MLAIWPLEVLARFPAVLRGSLVALGNHGGFSGAHLWRLESPSGQYCLKAWPADWRSAGDLAWIHSLMAQSSALAWMPRVISASEGASFVSLQGRLWELVTWMPGAADFARAPSNVKLTSACRALAELHRVWAPLDTNYDVCPAVVRRLESWRAWQALMQAGWRPVWRAGDPYAPLAEPIWQRVLDRLDEVPRLLTPWLARPVSVQPCVCDLWHDHILFTGDVVTGIIDFGSVKVDHVAVDLARMLGSMVGDDESMWQIGLDAYAQVRPLEDWERELARDLDATGTIISAMNWLRWLYHERRVYEQPTAVVGRLEVLTKRMAEKSGVKNKQEECE